MQYRMHPSISLFPNKEFYDNQIMDGPNVKEKTYERHCLKGTMFGPYSFINVSHGAEQFHNSHSRKNMVEVAVVVEILASLFKGNFLQLTNFWRMTFFYGYLFWFTS